MGPLGEFWSTKRRALSRGLRRHRPVMGIGSAFLILLSLQAQTPPLAKEYIRLNARVVAIENTAAGSGGGHARQFASATDQVNWGPLPSSPLRIVGNLSIGMWIKLPSTAQGCLICDGLGGSLNSSTAWPYFMSIAGSSGSWSIIVGHDTATSNINNASSPFAAAIPNDTWVYLGLSRDTTAQTYMLYKSDGTSITTVGTFAYSGNPPSTAGTATGSQVILSSADYRADLALIHLVGSVEEHYVAARAWSSSEHLLAAQGNPPSGSLVLACLMGNTPEVDISGSGLSGTVTGTTLVAGHD